MKCVSLVCTNKATVMILSYESFRLLCLCKFHAYKFLYSNTYQLKVLKARE